MNVTNKSSVYDATSVSNECVDICFTEREDLVKRCMNSALDNMHRGSKDDVPSGPGIFSYTPSKENFVEYASRIMSSDTPPKDIMKAMMVPILERFARASKNRKRITFDPEEEDDEVTGWESRDPSVPEQIVEPVLEPSRNKRLRLTRVGGASTAPRSSNASTNKKTRGTAKKPAKNTKSTRGSRIAKRTRSCLSRAAKEKEEGDEEEEQEEQDEEDMVTEPDEHEYQDREEMEVVQSENESSPEGDDSGKFLTQASDPEDTPYTGDTGDTAGSPVKTLPVPLSHTNSGSMTVVSNEYFPDAEFVFPGIYILPNDSGYVLFCVDNGRYSNSWGHHNDVTTLTWVTANKDKSRNALKAISESKNVFVFRKISGESMFRYMGKVFRSGTVDKRAGTVKLAVC